ncbi:hypothetical protein SB719_21340, partial [Pantoea sp. SIMBA_079]
LEFLMHQEMGMHRNHPYQGADESMDILAYLLAKFRDVNSQSVSTSTWATECSTALAVPISAWKVRS